MLVPWVIWAGKATHLWVKFQPYFRFDTPTFPFKFLLLKFMMMLLWNVNFPWDTLQNSHHMLTWRTRLGFKIIEVETSQCLKNYPKMSHFYDYFYDLPPKTNQYVIQSSTIVCSKAFTFNRAQMWPFWSHSSTISKDI